MSSPARPRTTTRPHPPGPLADASVRVARETDAPAVGFVQAIVWREAYADVRAGRGARDLRAAGLRHRLAPVAGQPAPGRLPAARSVRGRPGRRASPPSDPARTPTPTRRPASCRRSACTRRRAGSATGHGCSTRPSTRCAGPAPTAAHVGAGHATSRPGRSCRRPGCTPTARSATGSSPPTARPRARCAWSPTSAPTGRLTVSVRARDRGAATALDPGTTCPGAAPGAVGRRGDRGLRHQLRRPVRRRWAVDPADPGRCRCCSSRAGRSSRSSGSWQPGRQERPLRSPPPRCSGCATASTACRSPGCWTSAGSARPLAAHLTIDESTAVGVAQPETAAARLGFWATGLGVFVLWNLTTLVGALVGDAMGDPRRYGLDAAAAAAFCALLWPRLKSRTPSRSPRLAAVIAVARRTARARRCPGTRRCDCTALLAGVWRRAHHDPPPPHQWPDRGPGTRGRSMSTWTALLIAGGLAFVLKYLGYVVPAPWLDGDRTTRITSALPIALLAALVGVQTLTSSSGAVTSRLPRGRRRRGHRGAAAAGPVHRRGRARRRSRGRAAAARPALTRGSGPRPGVLDEPVTGLDARRRRRPRRPGRP